MPCQHRVYKIFLFFLRNKIKAVIDAKSLKLQGLSAPEAPMSRLRRSSAPFYPALLFSIFPGKHFRPAISQAGVSKRRALLTFSEFFFDCALAFYLQKAGKKLYTISHFRQLGNQKETLMVEIPTVASPSRLFGVLYQQHLSKIF